MSGDLLAAPLAEALAHIVPDGKHVAVQVKADQGGGAGVLAVSIGEHVEIAGGIKVKKGQKPSFLIDGKASW